MVNVYSTPSDYWIKPGALTISLNALDNPQYTQASVLSGAVIMAFKPGVIEYDSSHNYRKWKLIAENTFFKNNDAKYVYARLDRKENATQALIVYSSVKLDILGKTTAEEEGGEEYPLYYYIYLGSITASVNNDGKSIPRVWDDSFNFGTLATDQSIREESSSDFSKMFRLNEVTGMIEVLKTISEATINIIRVGKKLIFGEKEITDIKRSIDSDKDVPVDDGNLATSKYVEENINRKALRRDHPDQTDFLLKFLGGINFKNNKGIDPFGVAKLKSIEADYIKVLEIIYNRLNAMEGDFSFTDFGTIDAIEQIGECTYRLTIRKRWETDFTAMQTDDILYGCVNSMTESLLFYFSWFRCLAKNVNDNTLTVVLYPDDEVPSGKNFPPTVGMNITRRGNSNTPLDGSHNSRQDSWLLSSNEGAILFFQNVYKPILDEHNYALAIGKLPKLKIFENLPVGEDDLCLYAKTVIAQNYYQIDYNGDVSAREVSRGEWSAEVATSDKPYRRVVNVVETPNGSKANVMEVHSVYRHGCKWACVVDKTTDEPKWNSPGWQFLEGNNSYSISFASTAGFQFFYGAVNTTVVASVLFGSRDITAELLATPGADVQWTRNTENIPDDNAWRPTIDGTKNCLKLTQADMGRDWLTRRKTIFTCTVFIPVGEEIITKSETIGFNL